MVGLPVQQLEGLLREAAPGDILSPPASTTSCADLFDAGRRRARAAARHARAPSRSTCCAPTAARVTGVGRRSPTVAHRRRAAPAAAAGSATLAEIAPGALLGGRFEILSMLGAGGMGVVYKARDRELDDLVALKMLKREVAGDREPLERLKSELKLARKITHPNVLRTFDFGEVDGMPVHLHGVRARHDAALSARPAGPAAVLGRAAARAAALRRARAPRTRRACCTATSSPRT